MDETRAGVQVFWSHDAVETRLILISGGWTTVTAAEQEQTGQQGAGLRGEMAQTKHNHS